ncbi:ABC transporter ATP-binding protein [Bacillus thuringiensis]|uniref:ABC transporter ATP-binding protein n=3 Tax=Bacillus cereus group TaxID=86661 RepID=UPI002FFF18C8
METTIEVKNLIKKYKTKMKGRKLIEKDILKDISFTVQKGEVFGLLGPNGAGKSTTFKILTTLLTPTSGEVYVLGKNTKKREKEIRKEINFIFGGEKGVYVNLTASEYLAYFCSLYKIPKKNFDSIITELIDLVGLSSAAHQKISTFSKGMIQRLHIARSLINNPKVLFLDEPTIGLDPVGAKILRDIVKNLSQKGITIILTTHYMHEAEELCDKIAFLKSGEIIEYGKKDDILEKYTHLNIFDFMIKVKDKDGLRKSKLLQENTEFKDIKDNILFLRLNPQNNIDINTAESELSNYGTVIESKKKLITLEDIYLELMKEKRC